MILTKSEENKNKIVSGIITLIIFTLFLIFLILFQIITPNPPFPESGDGGGQELSFGMVNVGNDEIDYGSMGKVTDVLALKVETKEYFLTDENGEDVRINKSVKENKSNTMLIKPKLTKEVDNEKTDAEKLAEKFKKNTGKNAGGIGNNDESGDNGSPTGDPFKNGNGGTGNASGIENGDGQGSLSGLGKGKSFSINLKGRAVVKPPKLPSDTKEEGKVVVEITVDNEGNVIEANPNGRGTTTSSSLLKAKAKQAAFATKFNVEGKFEEQRGTITIIFSFD